MMATRSWTVFGASLAGILLAGCGGKALSAGGEPPPATDAGGAGDGGAEASGQGITWGVLPPLPPLDASMTPPFDATSVAAARAMCNAAHGPVDPYQGPTELAQKLVGSWFHCAPSFTSDGPSDWLAIEFTADGLVYVLIDDGSGGLIAGMGIDNQGTWSLMTDTTGEAPPGTWFLVIMGAAANAATNPQFETSPRRLDYDVAESKWFVPLVRQ
jgi:hypothetical protein